MESIAENPFVSVISKKCRNIRKKLEKIVKCEVQLASGKALNDEQLQLLGSKTVIEKTLIELDAIRSQLEEVAKEQASAPANIDAPIAPTVIPEAAPAVNIIPSEPTVESTADESPLVDATDEPAETELAEKESETMSADEASLKLLKVLHVYTSYSRVTGAPLPQNLDYFGKTLLGLTSVAGFAQTLQLSRRSAQLYLDEALSKTDEIVSGVTYEHMAALVDDLAAEMDAPHGRPARGPSPVAFREVEAEVDYEPEPEVEPEAEPEPELAPEPVFFHEDTTLPPPLPELPELPELDFLQPISTEILEEPAIGPETESVESPEPAAPPAAAASASASAANGASKHGKRDRPRGDRADKRAEGKGPKDEASKGQPQRRPSKVPRERPHESSGPQTGGSKKPVEPRKSLAPSREGKAAPEREEGVAPSRPPRKPAAPGSAQSSRPHSGVKSAPRNGEGRREKKDVAPKPVLVA